MHTQPSFFKFIIPSSTASVFIRVHPWLKKSTRPKLRIVSCIPYPVSHILSLLLVLLFPGLSARAGTPISYLQPFHNTTNQTLITTLPGWSWAASDGGGTDTSSRQYGRLSNAVGIGGIAGLAYNYSGGSPRAIVTWVAGEALTGGIPVNAEPQVAFHIGHSATGVETRVLIHIENQGWFVTTQTWTMPAGIAIGDFSTQAVSVSFAFTPTAAAWRALTFDGLTGTASSGFAVLTGAQDGLAADLPADGLITAVGLYHANPANTSSRFDDFHVSWTLPPNDDAALLSLLGQGTDAQTSGTGTDADPFVWEVSLPDTVTDLGATDLDAPSGATLRLFRAPGFQAADELAPGERLALGESGGTLWVEITATDGVTRLYYELRITSIETVAGNLLLRADRPFASFYDAAGDGQRDGRPALPWPAELDITLEFAAPPAPLLELNVSRHTLTPPLRGFLQFSRDLQHWETLPEPLEGPGGDPEGSHAPVSLDPADAPILFVRAAAADARVLPELTPASARNLWARFMAGALTVMNEARTHGNGTRGADPQGRTFGSGDYEVVLRTLWSVGGWFYHPGRPATLDWVNPLDGSSGTVDLAAFARNALFNGTDPDHPNRWSHSFTGGNLGSMQHSVEAANAAWTAWAMQRGAAAGNPDSPWHDFDATRRANLQNWLAIHGSVPNTGGVSHNNIYNWNLFFVLNQEARRRLNAEGHTEFAWTQSQIDGGRAAVDALHRGGGWYTDFDAFDIFDEYIPWTFATHLLLHAHMGAHEADAATQIPGRPAGRTRAAILAELRDYFALTPYFFDLDGGSPEFGRSNTYKVSRLAGILIAYAVDRLAATEAPETWTEPAFPDSVSPGQLRRLVRLHLNHYLRNETFHWPSGLLREGLTPDTASSYIESYSVRGSTYWNMILFTGLWLIPDDDPFWTDPEEPLPAQISDFGLWAEIPQWFFHHHRERGDLRQYVVRSAHRTDAWALSMYHPKYGKFAYSTRFGFLQSAATRGDQNVRVGNRERRRSDNGDLWPVPGAGAETPPVLRTVHNQDAWRVSTLIFLHGPLEVRVHRITGASGETITCGGFALGHGAAETPPPVQSGDDWLYTQSSRGALLHARLLGFTALTHFSDTGHHSRDPAWRRLQAEAPAAELPAVFATLQVATATPFDPVEMRARVHSVTSTGATTTVTFTDGTTLTAPFLE